MEASACKSIDPRIRRTRQLLQQALERLLVTKDFQALSVQDITDAATVNRATFYDHYPDKFALLECMVASRFNELLSERGVIFDGTCSSALSAIACGVCDFLAKTPGMSCERQRQMEPHLESAMIAVVRGMILDGLKQHAPAGDVSPEMRATVAAWAIYGGAKEWVRTPDRGSSQSAAQTILSLVSPVLHPLHERSPEALTLESRY